MIDYQGSRPPNRGYGAPKAPQLPPVEKNDSRVHEYKSATSQDNNNNLDPFSALLKAGESSYSCSSFHHARSDVTLTWMASISFTECLCHI
jgi:hypothetical protein